MMLTRFFRYSLQSCIIWTLLIVVFAAIGLFVGLYTLDNTHTITLTDTGFSPAGLTIQQGDWVTFVNKRDTYFWPASNLHPTHALFAEFDSKEPLPPESSWTFQFTKEGTWGFHDHLAPLFEGKIIVEGTQSKNVSVDTYTQCAARPTKNERETCWSDVIEAAYASGGVKASFEVFADLFNNHQAFAADCHTYTHVVGQLAYADYANGKDFDVSDQVAYCSYGFFHGFMEALVFETGNYAGARDFCDYIADRLEGELGSVGPCIHGIGHGLTDGSDPRTYGDAQKMVAPGLAICAEVARTDYEEKICATGVYNALGELHLRDREAGILDEKDVYAVCALPEKAHIKEACYEDLKIVPYALANKQFKESLQYVVAINDQMHYKEAALENLALFHVYDVEGDEYAPSLEACRSLTAQALHIACIRGLAAGFINSGTPGKEYVRALDFCAFEELSETERVHCYDRTLHASYTRYAPEVFATICAIIPSAYRKSEERDTSYCDMSWSPV